MFYGMHVNAHLCKGGYVAFGSSGFLRPLVAFLDKMAIDTTSFFSNVCL